jgi:cellulose biosynthesis protein BcsQ
MTGQIITFYSYKGGTGRSMALANVACLLVRNKHRVLVIDWDMEAPGLHRFFRPYMKEQFPTTDKGDHDLNLYPGLIDLFAGFETFIREHNLDRRTPSREILEDLFEQRRLDQYILKASIALDFIKAGRFDDIYSTRINTFRWDTLFERVPWLYRAFASHLAERYDYVLIDSRTGLTDTSGICTMVMPQKLVTVFTPNFQSSEGALNMVRLALQYRRQSDDLRPLVVFPLVSRVDSSRSLSEDKWRKGSSSERIEGYQPQFEALFREVYSLPECNLTSYFDRVKIQHNADFAYGEQIAVIVEQERLNDTLSLAYAYSRFADRLEKLKAPWLDTPTDTPQTQPEVSATLSKPTSTRATSPPPTYGDVKLLRADLEARYLVFNRFALNDQRAYYRITSRRFRLAATQVNRLRAFLMFLTGMSAALLGILIAQSDASSAVIRILGVLIVAAPVLAVVFNTLADLYQWDRLLNIYDGALENLEVADALSPTDDLDHVNYQASLNAHVEGTLSVMRDESAQYGQLIKTPARIERFTERELERAALASFNLPLIDDEEVDTAPANPRHNFASIEEDESSDSSSASG